jgi:transcriptional regulator with XRE-family HTH domain
VTSIFREKMQGQELNIAELGRKVGIPRSTLSNLINDKKLPLMSQVRNISLALGVPLPHLIIEAERRLSECPAVPEEREQAAPVALSALSSTPLRGGWRAEWPSCAADM